MSSFWKETLDPREWDRPSQTFAFQMSLFGGGITVIILILGLFNK